MSTHVATPLLSISQPILHSAASYLLQVPENRRLTLRIIQEKHTSRGLFRRQSRKKNAIITDTNLVVIIIKHIIIIILSTTPPSSTYHN